MIPANIYNCVHEYMLQIFPRVYWMFGAFFKTQTSVKITIW